MKSLRPSTRQPVIVEVVRKTIVNFLQRHSGIRTFILGAIGKDVLEPVAASDVYSPRLGILYPY